MYDKKLKDRLFAQKKKKKKKSETKSKTPNTQVFNKETL